MPLNIGKVTVLPDHKLLLVEHLKSIGFYSYPETLPQAICNYFSFDLAVRIDEVRSVRSDYSSHQHEQDCVDYWVFRYGRQDILARLRAENMHHL